MKKKVIFVCLVGIDGSGKSSLATALENMITREGYKCKYVHGSIKPFLLRPVLQLGRFIFLRGKDKFDDYIEYSSTKKLALKKHPWMFRPYYYLLLLDYFPQIFIKIKIPLMLGKSIICDRYIYDTLINMALNLSYSNRKIPHIIQSWFRLFPKPDLVFLVDVPEQIALQRKNDIPSIHYLKERRTVYLGIRTACAMIILDGSQTLKELKRAVRAKVLKELL